MYQIIYRSFNLSHMKGTFWHISYDHLRSQQGVIHGQRPPTSAVADHTTLQWGQNCFVDTRYLVDTRWWIGHWKSLSTRHEQSGKRSKLSPILRKNRLIWVLLQATDACFFSPDYRNERWNELRCCFYCRLKWITFLAGWLKTASIEINRNGSSISPKPPNRSKQNGGTRRATKNWKNYWTRHLAQQTDCLLL